MYYFIKLGLRGGKVTYAENTDVDDQRYSQRKVTYSVIDKYHQMKKSVIFEMDDNFRFSAVNFEKRNIEEIQKTKKLGIKIKDDNPMFMPLKNFLRGEKSFTLYDNFSQYDIKQKTMEILDDVDNIKLIFNNGKDESELDRKFSILIKNKYIDEKNRLVNEQRDAIRRRLRNLFNEFSKTIKPEEITKDREEER